MSNTPPKEVLGCILSELPDGTRILDLSLKAGQLQLAFSAKQWALLGDSARWFHERAVPPKADPNQLTLPEGDKTDVQV